MKFLENLSIKGKIRLITLPLIGIAVVALGLLLYESVSNYIYTAQLNNANKVFDYILLSSAEQAKERGFTATMIGDPTITIQNSILQTRNQGDMYLDSALTLVNSMTLNSLSTQQLSLIKELREKRNTMRKNIDSYLGINAGTIEQRTAWVKAQTTLIRAEQKLAQTLFGSDEGLNTILEMNSQIKNSIFLVSEHAGLERATIGGVITAGTPIPVKTFENLMKYRGIVEENIQIVSQYAKNTAATPKIRQAIAQMDAKFLGEFEKLRKDVYAASASQSPYPVNTAEWVKKSTEAINSILTVSRCISDEVALIATEQKNNSISQSLIALLFFLIGIVGIFASFTIGSIINKAVVELTQTAHRVIDGDLTAQSKRISNDELGTLSTTFNIMTQTIEERVVGSQLMINTVIDMTSDKSTTDDALRAMLEGMKKLLHAQYGAVAIFDAKNSVKTFITTGISEEQKHRIGHIPHITGLLEFINQSDRGVKIDDMAKHHAAKGFPSAHPPMKTLIGVPIRYNNKSYGNIYFTEKEDGKLFTNYDLEILELIAKMTGILVADRYTKHDLRSVVGQVQELSISLSTAMQTISGATEELAAGSSEQSSQAIDVAAAVEEMAHNSMETAQSAGKTAEFAQSNGTIATEGQHTVEHTILKMRNIASVVKSSSATVKRLGAAGDSIGEIVTVISDIADQTNLLALNAAIEAARAGEQGRGFAVVADEVRKLAERTTTATKQIRDMIRSIQTETAEAVHQMDSGTKEVEEGIILADNAGIALHEVVTSASQMYDLITQIAASSQEQSRTSESVAKSVSTISAISSESASTVMDIARNVTEINNLAEIMKDLLLQIDVGTQKSVAEHKTNLPPYKQRSLMARN